MQMGGGEINEQARTRWHDYMTNRYMFGQPTGIEQGFEADGYIPAPNEGYGLDIVYANTSFGQGMTATPLQMAAALASVVNGGNYYQPYLVDRYYRA
jgi:cell division protein FtsI/penicillin-binding protein 2